MVNYSYKFSATRVSILSGALDRPVSTPPLSGKAYGQASSVNSGLPVK